MLESLKRKGIKLSPEELADKLITDDLIKDVLIPGLDGEKVDAEGRYHRWTYYSFQVYWGVKAYRLVWCVADNEPHVLGIMDCYRQSRFDKDD